MAFFGYFIPIFVSKSTFRGNLIPLLARDESCAQASQDSCLKRQAAKCRCMRGWWEVRIDDRTCEI